MIKVAIVEDNETIRNGLKEFLNYTSDYKCVADYSDCESLLENLSVLMPDIILMDIVLPGISGIEGIKEIKKQLDDPKIIILTIYAENENLFEALSSGASSYLEKKTPPSQMMKLIGEVFEGKSYMNTYIARNVLKHFSNRKAVAGKHHEVLDKSELNILNSLIEGKSPKAIADFFNIPKDTVHHYFYNIYQKLHKEYELKNSTLV